MSLRADRLRIVLAVLAGLCLPSVAHALEHSPIYNLPERWGSWDGIEYLVWDSLPKPDAIDVTSLEARELRTGRQLWEVKLYDNKGTPRVDDYPRPHVWVKWMGYTDGQIVLVNTKGDVIKVDASNGRIVSGAGHYYYGDDEVSGRVWGGGLPVPTALAIAGVLTVVLIAVRRRAFTGKRMKAEG
jgi:hypothetical protein